MTKYYFYIQGPDDNEPECIGVGTEIEFDDLLSRHTMDEVCTMTAPISEKVIRRERGWMES